MRTFPTYRWIPLLALMAITTLLSASVHAQEEGDWPDELDYPPMLHAPTAPKPTPATQATAAQTPQLKEKRRLWPFGKKKEAAGPKLPKKPLTEEQIINVGPRETAARPDALLALSFPLRGEGYQAVPSGFYLLRETARTDNTRTVALMKQNRPWLSVTLTEVSAPADPVKKVAGAGKRLEASFTLSPDQQTLVIHLREDDRRFNSPPLPTAIEQRPELRF